MSTFATLQDFLHNNPAGKRAIVRVDLNVPLVDGKVGDATRIRRVLPTINMLADAGARIVLLAHFGRPKGQRKQEDSLQPVYTALKDLLPNHKVYFGEDCTGAVAENAVNSLKNGDVVLLENVRFYAGEEQNDASFAKDLAANGDVFINDAFSAAHRAHASTVGLAQQLPAYAGLLMEEELTALNKALGNPQRPVLAIVGGAKVSTKLDLLSNLISKVDKLAIGGGMANTFLFAQGHEVGSSLCEKDLADTARGILAKAQQTGCEILLPTDVVVANQFNEDATTTVSGTENAPVDQMIVDIGPDTRQAWQQAIKESKTAVWNGPAGAFEIEPFSHGTRQLADDIASAVQAGNLLAVAGGGDTVAALELTNTTDKMTYVSTAGGAFLEWLEGKELPGVAALYNAQNAKAA